MVVGINYTQDGNRTIACIDFCSEADENDFNITKVYCKNIYDEAYIVDFNPNCTDFINEIVLKGCRI